MSVSFPFITRVLAWYLRRERWLFTTFGVLLFISASVLMVRFYRNTTVLVPAEGGTYIEGSVGDLQPLNPWFTMANDVNRDIVSLVFSGLLKYNPLTKSIEDDLATWEVSKDGKIYTVKLKEGLLWHDSTKEKSHPVTAEDVVFTYSVIQEQDFPNGLLHQNFKGVTIEQIDERTVQFRLEKPYSFFPSNLTLGLLPKRSFEGVPINLLDQTLDFGFQPIGAGPYALKSIIETEISTEVTLERRQRSVGPRYRLERIVFRIFPDYQALLSDLRNLDGIRIVPYTEKGEPVIPNRFTAVQYSLPQYVALFFNMERPALKDRNLRLGLQLGTNKKEISESIGQSTIIDTPLLEIDTADWRYSFDPNAAQGALYESQWYFPEKVQLQQLLEQKEANDRGPLHIDPVVFLDTGAALAVTVRGPEINGSIKLNGVVLTPHLTESGAWIAALPTAKGTGSLRIGLNLVRLTDAKGKIIDSAYVRRSHQPLEYQRALQEQKILNQFIRTRAGSATGTQRITVNDFTLDKGYLRKRRVDDALGYRINDRGERLALKLVTSPMPLQYAEVATMVQEQWKKLGVDVHVVIPETRPAFEEILMKRDYDILLFGQSLLDNLDSYPYWHSSGVQRNDPADARIDAYNLSQYASFEADALLETIRGKYSEEERQNALRKLQETLKRDVPAVFVYSPLYTFAHRASIQGIDIGKLSLHSDRYLSLYQWFTKQERVFPAGKSWFSFFPWLSSLILQERSSFAVSSGSTLRTDTSDR